MHVLAFVNQKGGCGKTTCAVNLAAALALRDKRVLLVDLDPQAHATLALGVDVDGGPSMIEVLGEETPLDAAAVDVPGGFRLTPATEALAEFEEVSERMVYPERVLEAALRETAGGYDYALLDCPPRADGVLTANALRASHLAILVVECGAFALQGALKARRILEAVAERHGREVEMRAVATLFDRRTRFSRDLLIGMQARFGSEMFNTAIRTAVRLREAAAQGIPVQVAEPGGKAADDFAALADEILALEERPADEVVPTTQPPTGASFPRMEVDPVSTAPATGGRLWTP